MLLEIIQVEHNASTYLANKETLCSRLINLSNFSGAL